MESEKYEGKYRIESTCLPHLDYASVVMYFVTICTKKFLEIEIGIRPFYILYLSVMLPKSLLFGEY